MSKNSRSPQLEGGYMSNASVSILSTFDEVWVRLSDRLSNLTDDEYFWMPAEYCWTMRVGENGLLTLDGEGGGGPAPNPTPVTTIAWRVGHIGSLVLSDFSCKRFNDDNAHRMARELPADAASVSPYLDVAFQEWMEGLRSLNRTAWEASLGSNWGPYSDSNTYDLALHILDELIHHGAEIALLRDLWAAQ
jgi:hypothetical protein